MAAVANDLGEDEGENERYIPCNLASGQGVGEGQRQ